MMASQLEDKTQERSQQANETRQRSRILQNFVLVWLDASIDVSKEGFQNSLEHLHRIMGSIEIFLNIEECLKYIDAVKEEKIFMIISGAFGQSIVPEIHGNKQLDSIYIFCGNKKFHKEWCQEWAKVKGVHTHIERICEKLLKDRVRCDQDAIPMSFSGVDPSFMYTQLLKESLLDMQDNDHQEAIEKLVNYCRDRANLPNDQVQQFKNSYKPETAIWWYTGEFFLYPMLNRALRAFDIDTILAMGFFIRHLHQQLQIEQQKQDVGSQPFKVYRGQGLSHENFEKLKNTEDGLISFNNFLSTSRDRNVSFSFAERSLADPNNVGILFVMQVDPSRCCSTPFAKLDHLSFFNDSEKEILFSTHTIFRVDKIKQIRGHRTERLWRVDLSLTDDNDNQLNELTQNFRKEIANLNKWDRIGRILLKSDQPAKATELYEILIESAQNERQRALYNNQLGLVHSSIGNFPKALEFYEKDLEISKKHLPTDHPDLATSYSNIGSVYADMGEYSKALEFYEKDLEISEKHLPANHPNLATSYSNIGLVYKSMGEYSKALEFYEKARSIREKSLPENHPDLAISFNNIGLVYSNMGEYSKALEFYEKARAIQEKSLPFNHPILATSYNNIGLVYSNMGEYSKALEFYEKAHAIKEKSLPAKHPSLATSYSNIGLVYSDMGEYFKALEFCEKDLEICKQSLPANHPDLATSYSNIGQVYYYMQEYSKALEFYEKARGIRENSLPANHPDLANSHNNIGWVYREQGDFGEALRYFERTRDIQQICFPPNHPRLLGTLENIEFVRSRLKEVK